MFHIKGPSTDPWGIIAIMLTLVFPSRIALEIFHRDVYEVCWDPQYLQSLDGNAPWCRVERVFNV